jgi:oligopeptide/dipeptide ABC transporter ATP-binding protein
MTSLLEIRDLRVEITTRRGVVRAVDGVSLSVDRSHAVGIVGESGCGKSTLLRAILGLLPRRGRITNGSISVNGQDVTASGDDTAQVRGRVISMIFQDPMTALNPAMRVGDQIAEAPHVLLGYDRGRARTRAMELMRLVGIAEPDRRYGVYPYELSGGMRQRIVIAIALSTDPQLLLCDEPTTALDVTIQAQILGLLRDISASLGLSIVYVTHDLAVVAQMCRDVCVMYAGEFVETGAVAAVFSFPRHPYTSGLLGSVPDAHQGANHLLPIPGMPPDLANPPTGCRFHPRCEFATSECLDGVFPLIATADRHATACIHHDELDKPAGEVIVDR